MKSDRRSFLRLGSLVVGATLLRPHALFALGAEKGVLSFDAAEMRLLNFAASYGSSVRVTGVSVLNRLHGSGRGLHLLVEVTDFVKLAGAILDAPFKNFFADGNTLAFATPGSASVIENLSAKDFAARLAQLSRTDNIAFAHDAILYDPATKTFTDPFGALDGGELKLINRPTKTPAALEVALRGIGDAHAAGMAEGQTFAEWKAQLLKSSVHSSAAQPIAAVFVRGLPALAALGGSDNVKTAVGSPLVSSAIDSALELKSRTVIGEFDRVRAIFGESYSDGAVWFYVLLGKQLKKDTRGWVDANLLEDARWREAFDNANRIDRAFDSPQLKSQR
jgi:hypothetical protein